MCDEYYDERMKAVWRALADESELERDEESEEESPRPIAIEPLDLPKAKPKALLRRGPPFGEKWAFPPRDARLSPKS